MDFWMVSPFLNPFEMDWWQFPEKRAMAAQLKRPWHIWPRHLCPVPKLTYATLDVVSVLGIFARETRKKTSFATPHQCSRFPGPVLGLAREWCTLPDPENETHQARLGVLHEWFSIEYQYCTYTYIYVLNDTHVTHVYIYINIIHILRQWRHPESLHTPVARPTWLRESSGWSSNPLGRTIVAIGIYMG